MAGPGLPTPRQGEIWFIRLPTDPPGKHFRPAIIVSIDARNQNHRALTVLVVPLSTTIRANLLATQMLLEPGQTGLTERSVLDAGGITVVAKTELRTPSRKLRQLTHGQICEVARRVNLAMGVFPDELQ